MSSQLIHLGDPIENLAIGRIIEVDGSHLVVDLEPQITELLRIFGGETYPIGQFGSIVRVHFGRRIIYAFVGRLRMKSEYQAERGLQVQASNDERVLEADLFGEGEWVQKHEEGATSWQLKFERGIATYPLPQQTVYLTPKAELRLIYGDGSGALVRIGEHVGTGGAPCYAQMEELLGKHTAVLGSTGSGKSAAVSVLLHSILDRGSERKYERWNPRFVIFDPHNEYGKAFPGHLRLSTDEGSLSLPYWLLNLQETINLIVGKTEFVATSQANILKTALMSARAEASGSLQVDSNRINVDSPVPYALARFRELVNEQRPNNKNQKDHEPFDSVIAKLDVLERDSRMNFMMRPWTGGDGLAGVLKQFVGEGPTVRIVDLSGVPNEVAGIASAVIARTVFNMKVWQTKEEREGSPVVLVCEEAHRYVPNRGEALYESAQEAVRRIAKEGRKYGLGLILVSQRPSEVEATVLSQCNSWIVLRTTNESDREHVRGVLPDSVAGLTKMLPGLRRREAIFVGQAALLPSRVLISHLEENRLPRSADISFDDGWQQAVLSDELIAMIGQRWRYQSR